jgi:hypothetical protein
VSVDGGALGVLHVQLSGNEYIIFLIKELGFIYAYTRVIVYVSLLLIIYD